MRTSLTLVAAVLVLSGTVSLAAAREQPPPPRGSAVKKFGRGMANVATAPLEIVHDVSIHTQRGVQAGQYPFTAFPEGLVKGLVTGTARTLLRLASGLYDIVTFPFEAPPNYDSLIQPPSVFAAGYWTVPKRPRQK